MLRSLLSDHGGFEMKLAQLPFFQALLAKWKFLARPQDAAEYTGFLLEGLGLPTFQQSWDRRVIEQNRSVSFDTFRTFQPLRLQFPHDVDAAKYYSLQALLDSWHEDHGMIAALTHAPDLLCVQIDRVGADSDSQVVKLTNRVNFFAALSVPVFHDHGITCDTYSYTVVAATAHLGSDPCTGHYQAITKAQISGHGHMGVQWYLSDDNTSMRVCFSEVDHFVPNVTLLWLCRLDRVELYNRFDQIRAMPDNDEPPSHRSNEVLQYF